MKGPLNEQVHVFFPLKKVLRKRAFTSTLDEWAGPTTEKKKKTVEGTKLSANISSIYLCVCSVCDQDLLVFCLNDQDLNRDLCPLLFDP